MMSVAELHEHYRSVKARITDPRKKFVPKEPPTAKMRVPDSATILRHLVPRFATPSDEIIYYVAKKHKVSVADLRGPCRKVKFVKARQEAAYEIRMKRGLTLPQIATILGNRDHTSILHGIRQHAKLLAKQAQEAQ
jgi:chromosomal replication initiation ATPase DnaA